MPLKPYVVSTLVDFGAITESLAEQGFPLFPIKSIVQPDAIADDFCREAVARVGIFTHLIILPRLLQKLS
jgi:hypothetical protein